MAPLHLAFDVAELDRPRMFHEVLMGCAEGRSAGMCVGSDFVGDQPRFPLGKPFGNAETGKVGDLGVLMPRSQPEKEPGEQLTMIFTDPSGDPIKTAGFADLNGACTT
ncbi:dioxygenase [uncultured Tateyamaria sp.]|uniref:dioxygenase n=1 Tax=uncultured Tateyamaria sp. TaxID=455651 RepID=UPI00261B6DF4|nr:dioxygenase [uncultured Tateyamaria sp.]